MLNDSWTAELFSEATALAVADVFEGEVDYGEEGGHGGGEAFYALDVAFVAFDAVFEGG
jgi:hypothetical protein